MSESTSKRSTGNPGVPCLRGLVGSVEGHRVPINRTFLTLGRDTQCEIALDHAFLSRRHATFHRDRTSHVVVRDLGSTHGTYVNGSQVQKSPLRDGDIVGFGPQGLLTFRFESGTARESSPEKSEIPSARTARPSIPNATSSTVDTRSRRRPRADSQSPRVATSSQSLLRIGRALDNDVVLASPGVSRYHAQIDYASGAPCLSDVGSLNGTFVNGQPVRQGRHLAPDDLVFLGGFLLRVNGREISSNDLSSSRLTASKITQAYGDLTVIRDVSFAILPREFVGILGPSGCGKSTLMDALNGLRPAKSGKVFINELDLYQDFDAVRRSMGYVPQRDILHDQLTVDRTLYYAALLRLPERVSRQDVRHTIDDVVRLVGLTDQRERSFKQLSGGQQKRLSLAIELLTKPTFLFLDEPTSPLDPETSENLMLLFRHLADEGRIVVMVTHKFEKFEQMHQIILLTKGGYLAYFGPPKDALRYFECRRPSGLYRKVGEREPHEIGQEFETSKDFQTHVATRLKESKQAADTAQSLGATAPASSSVPDGSSRFRQWRILTARYFEIKLKDRRNTLLLIGQAPVIAFILAVIASGTVNDAKTLFIGAVIAVWFGGNNAIREIVSELPIYKRERLVNLKIPSYLWSKFTVLGVIAFVQSILFVGTLVLFGSLDQEDAYWVGATLCLTAFGGVSLGLLCSAAVNSTEKAMSVLPLILVPQLLLSGFMKPLDDFYLNPVTQAPASQAQYLDYQRLSEADEAPGKSPEDASGADSVAPVTMVEGLGNARLASALILARWSVDGLVHCVSRTDTETRARLARRFFIAAYDHVWAGDSTAEIESAFRRHTYLNWLAILLTIAVYLTLAGLALKRRDSL